MISPIRTYRVWRHCRVPLRRRGLSVLQPWAQTVVCVVLISLIGIATGIAYGGWW